MSEYPTPSQQAQEWLMANPGRAEDFNVKFGAGAAESVLGQQTSQEQPQTAEAGGGEDEGNGLIEGFIDGSKGVLNGVESAINEGVETIQSAGTFMEERAADLGIPTRVQILDKDGNFDPQLQTPEEAREAGIPEPRILPELDFVDSPQSVGGKVTEGLSQFFTGFLITRRATGLRGLKGEMANGAITDASFFDPLSGNLSNFLEENEMAIPMVTEALSIDPDDPEWEGRVKNAAEGLLIGGALETMMRGLKGLAKVRKAREAGDDAAEEAAQKELEEVSEEIEAKVEDGTLMEENAGLDEAKVEGDVPGGQTLAEDAGLDDAAKVSGDDLKEASDVAEELTKKGGSKKAGSYVDPDKLKEWVGLRDAVDPDDLTKPGATWFNYEKMDGPIEGQKVIEVMAQALEESGATAKFGLDKPETLETTYRKALGEVASLTGTGIDAFTTRIEKMAGDTQNAARTVVAGKMVLQTLGREINSLATRIDQAYTAKGGVDPDLEQKLLDLMDTHNQTQLHLKAVQTAAARATSAGRIRTADNLDTKALDRITQIGGSERVRKLAKALRGADANATAKMVRDFSKKGKLDMFNEYWINAILSGYKTHMVNLTSNAINTALLPAERIIGGALTGNLRQSRVGAAQLRQYMSLRNTVFSSIRMAGKSWYQESNILDSVAKIEGDWTSSKAITAENFGMKPGTKSSALVDGMGKFLRLPSRFLMAEDEFFKQINFRSNLMAELSVSASDMTDEALAKMGYTSKGEFVQAEFEKAFTNLTDAEAEWQRMVDLGKVADDPAVKERYINQSIGTFKSGNKAAETAIRNARAATFTTPLDKNSTDAFTRFSAGYQQLANRHPLLRQITPFIQTPVNILSVAWDRTPGANLFRKQFRERLRSGDPAVRAEAAGQLATSVGLASALWMLAYEGRITGGGPTDGKQREMWHKDPTWQPYSINLGSAEEPQWVEYRRLDPHGFLFGIVGDMIEMQQAAEMDPSFDGQSLFAYTVAAIGNNLTSKTWLQGISDLVEVMEAKDRPWVAQQWLNSRAASLTPFSSLVRQTQDGIDPVMREARTLTDSLKKTTPGMSGDLAIRYDWISGKAVESPSHLLGYIRANSNQRDLVAEELRNLQYGFTGPDRKLGQVTLSSEQYQEWSKIMGRLKLGGRTLKEQIQRTMESSAYDYKRERVPDAISRPAESHRVRMISKIISKYKAASKQVLLERNPDLNEAYRQWKMFERKANAGVSQPGERDQLFLDFR